jgi:hypothetical protein
MTVYPGENSNSLKTVYSDVDGQESWGECVYIAKIRAVDAVFGVPNGPVIYMRTNVRKEIGSWTDDPHSYYYAHFSLEPSSPGNVVKAGGWYKGVGGFGPGPDFDAPLIRPDVWQTIRVTVVKENETSGTRQNRIQIHLNGDMIAEWVDDDYPDFFKDGAIGFATRNCVLEIDEVEVVTRESEIIDIN